MTIQEAIDRAFGKSAYSSAWEPTGDAQLLATEVKRLQDLHHPRDTRKGEWPDEGESIQWWSKPGQCWIACVHHWTMRDLLIWLPAPPSPEGD